MPSLIRSKSAGVTGGRGTAGAGPGREVTAIRYASLLATMWLIERLGNRQASRAQAPQKGTRNPRASVRAEDKRDAPIPPVDSAV